jgi:hypothetical protein
VLTVLLLELTVLYLCLGCSFHGFRSAFAWGA